METDVTVCAYWSGLKQRSRTTRIYYWNYHTQLWGLAKQSLQGCVMFKPKVNRLAIRKGRSGALEAHKHELNPDKDGLNHVCSCCCWPRWRAYPAEAWAIHHEAEHTQPAQELQKLKLIQREERVIAGKATASCQWGESADQQQGEYGHPKCSDILHVSFPSATWLPLISGKAQSLFKVLLPD